MSDRPATEPRTEAGRRMLRRRSYWSGNDDIRAAILAIEAEAAALDVERLTRAIEIEDDRLPFLDAGIDSTATPRAVAEQVAERYARLSTKEGRE